MYKEMTKCTADDLRVNEILVINREINKEYAVIAANLH